ncbi:MAG TPA: hypothetical protein VNW26_06295 [Steroidobacteraceae bacterium]|jgi:hypothetical protein|nr:hypothetical protein [Steroidobacteraceae bacterium]
MAIDRDEAARAEILARLAASRAELREIFDPPPEANGGGATGASNGGFPRSRTVQMIMSGRGLSTLGALAAGLIVARPALALRLLRMLPTGALGRMLLMRAVTAMRQSGKRRPR